MSRLTGIVRALVRRTLWRVLAFDVAAPAATIAALVFIGVGLGWPLWWVSVCSMLVLLVVAAVVVNVVLARRRSASVGTDDGGPRLRLAVVAVAAAALLAGDGVSYTHWTVPERDRTRDSAEVVRVATAMAQAAATFSPQDPAASINQAADLMVPSRVNALKDLYAKSTASMAQGLISAQAQTISAGVEVLQPTAASVAVVMRGTRSRPDTSPFYSVITLRVKLTQTRGHWLVFDVAPIHR